MDNTKLQNKALKVDKKVTKEVKVEAPKKSGYELHGVFYTDFNEIPGARSKKEMLLAKGAIKKV